MNEQLAAQRLRTSADYVNIERMARSLAGRAGGQRPSAMLEFAVMEQRWRALERGAWREGYDIFAAWEHVSLVTDALAVQLHWLSATYEGRGGGGDPFADVAARDVEELRVKNANYGESWKRRGGVGAFMMLARKWDRLDNLLAPTGGGASLDHVLARNPGNVLDDVGDLRRYLLLVADEAPRAQRARPAPAREERAWVLAASTEELVTYWDGAALTPLAGEAMRFARQVDAERAGLSVNLLGLTTTELTFRDTGEPGPGYVNQD